MTIVESCFNSPSILKVRQFIAFLKETAHKPYSEDKVIHTIFQTEKITLNKQWATCHLWAVIDFLEMKDRIDNRISEDTIRTVISDLTEYLKILKPDYAPNIPVAYSHTNPGQHYRDSNHMFECGEIRESSRTHVYRDILVVFMMRTALEKKVKQILGVDYLKDKNNKPVGLAALIDLIKRLDNVEIAPNINWEHILLINKWMNFHIHKGIRPYPWIIFKAIAVFDNLMSPSSRFQWYRKQSDINFKIKAKDKSKLIQEIKEKIESMYPSGTYHLYEPQMPPTSTGSSSTLWLGA